MPVLKSQKRELFAQGLAKGLQPRQSAESAGFTEKSAPYQASRLAKDLHVIARVAELKELICKAQEAVLQGVNAEVARAIPPFVRAFIQERQYRQTIYQDFMDRAMRLIAARAEAYAHVKPGGDTGLLVETIKSVRVGKKVKLVREYAFDRALHAEIRDYAKQASIEAGDWEEAHRIVAPAGEDLSHLTPEQLFAEQRVLLEARAKIEALRSGQAQPLMIDAAAGSVEVIEESGSEVEVADNVRP